MWRTGFDAPACSTIYLDRPMRNHTLMQTIARANRVFGAKVNGLIVDYVGIFRDLQKALAIYGAGPRGELRPGERPIEDKDALVARLGEALAEAEAFCAECGVDVGQLLQQGVFEHIRLMDDAVEKIILNDEYKSKYISLATNVDRLFRAILPDTRAGEFGPRRKLLVVLADKIRSLSSPVDISAIAGPVEALLDASTSARPFAAIGEPSTRYDLSRIDLADEFRRLVDEYNAGSLNIEAFFEALVAFTQRLSEEERRAVSENLTEEELAIFDLLVRPGPRLTKKLSQKT
jgi:type I restriction enzyme R subunit